MLSETLIREGRPEDARRLGELMTEGLRTRFSYLGQGVVTLLHKHMTTSRHCLCVVAERGGSTIGYAAVLTSGGKFYKEFVLRKGLLCGLIALPRLFRISNLRTIYTALTYFPGGGHHDPEAELVSIVVDRSAQGHGAGADLWNGVVRGLAARGIAELKICTGVENERANQMYRKRGCRLLRKEPLYHDSEVNVYVYEIPAPDRPVHSAAAGAAFDGL